MPGVFRRPQAGPYQLGADALLLTGFGDGYRTQRRILMYGRPICDGCHAVQSVPDDVPVQQRHLRQPDSPSIAQTIDQNGFIGVLESRGGDGVNPLDVSRLFLPNDDRHIRSPSISQPPAALDELFPELARVDIPRLWHLDLFTVRQVLADLKSCDAVAQDRADFLMAGGIPVYVGFC